MKKVPVAILVATLVIFGFGIFVITQKTNKKPDNQTSNNSQLSTDGTQTQQQEKATISLDGKTVSYHGVAGKNALEPLKAQATVVTEETIYGELVTSINGVSADSKTEYWAFYVNGSLSSVGAGSYTVQQGDSLEWRLESL
jgi:hypothetical protein